VEGRRPDLVIIDDRTRLDEGPGDVTTVIDTQLGKEPVHGRDRRSLTRAGGLREPGA
jgi:hypothetical protein